ncbi:MAG: hypothetical protein M1835_004700 [Candelina submexicana]|nr:MAG: hypothetical protein M1835_004700 [Candelina submexicana]
MAKANAARIAKERFRKRRVSFLKKASEMSTLCQADIYVIMRRNGKYYTYKSTAQPTRTTSKKHSSPSNSLIAPTLNKEVVHQRPPTLMSRMTVLEQRKRAKEGERKDSSEEPVDLIFKLEPPTLMMSPAAI